MTDQEKNVIPEHPLGEVFGFPVTNQSTEASRCRRSRLCPYNNKVANCTKDKANDPLGVCSVFDGDQITITCPVRFRERWLVAEDATAFFFPPDTRWTSLSEVRLTDSDGKSAGNIDIVLVSYDDRGKIIDFGTCEVQAVYISGNVRNPFESYMADPAAFAAFNWRGKPNFPRADFLSSSRKRLAPQLLFKGGILHSWGKKQAVAIDRPFFETLPALTKVDREDAELAFFVYELNHSKREDVYNLTQSEIVYTKFESSMTRLTKTAAGPLDQFVGRIQSKLDEKLDGNSPDVSALGEIGLS